MGESIVVDGFRFEYDPYLESGYFDAHAIITAKGRRNLESGDYRFRYNFHNETRPFFALFPAKTDTI